MWEISKEMPEINKKIDWYFLVSVIIFISVVLVSIFFHINNNSIEKDIWVLNMNITEISKNIDELKSSNEVAAYDIIKSSKKDIEDSIAKSNASPYIIEFINISKKNKMYFSWLNFDWKQISTNATYVSKDEKEPSIEWVSKFIEEFREWRNKMFNLNPINSIAWDNSKRTFSATLEIIK